MILVIGLKWLALSALIDAGALWIAVLLPAVLSRGAMAGSMATLPFAREDGFARHVGRPSRSAAGSHRGSALLSVAMAGSAGATAVIAVAVVSVALARTGAR
jgi:adenosylcobinamide-GDP ribazoletransferase